MGRVEDTLSSFGESMPEAKKPVANYLGCKRSGDTLYVSGRVSQVRGEVGTDLLIALFGDEGRHARTATGVAQLMAMLLAIKSTEQLVVSGHSADSSGSGDCRNVIAAQGESVFP